MKKLELAYRIFLEYRSFTLDGVVVAFLLFTEMDRASGNGVMDVMPSNR